MAPKKASTRIGPSLTAKRPIRGPSQALRSSAPRQPVGRVQSLVASMAGDPEALSRFAADMDGFLQQCSRQPSTSARPPYPAGASSPVSSASSEDGREGLSAGGVRVDSQLTQPHYSPAARGHSPRPSRSSRRASGRRNPAASVGRRGRRAHPPADVESCSGLSHVVSYPPAPGLAQPNLDSESSLEDSLPFPARRSSGGKRRRRKSSRKHTKRRRDKCLSLQMMRREFR